MDAELRTLQLEYENSDYDYLVYLAKEEYDIENSKDFCKKDLIQMMISIEMENYYR
jgi:hypothetical protein